MIYLHYKDTKTFGHSFSFLLIFKTLRASYLQVGNFSPITFRILSIYFPWGDFKVQISEKYSINQRDFAYFCRRNEI